MILGFKNQFVLPIVAGTKIHTIREDKHNRWHGGRQIQFATGVRTKEYNQFMSGECMSVQDIDISFKVLPITNALVLPCYTVAKEINKMLAAYIMIDGKYIDSNTAELLAIRDGFEDLRAFFKWFEIDFSGKLIHWTPLKY